MNFTPEHEQIADTVRKFVAKEINPHVAEWEAAQQFPAHEVFKKLGDLGLLGIKYPDEYGGMGLDFSYSMVMAEALGDCNCGGVPMAIGVHTDMCTPALARFGSDELRREFLRAGDRRRRGGLPRRQRSRRRLRRGGRQDHGAPRRRRLRDQRQQDVDHQRHAGRLVLPARQHLGRPGAQNKIADHRADEREGRHAARRSARSAWTRPTRRRSSSTTCACRSAT